VNSSVFSYNKQK